MSGSPIVLRGRRCCQASEPWRSGNLLIEFESAVSTSVDAYKTPCEGPAVLGRHAQRLVASRTECPSHPYRENQDAAQKSCNSDQLAQTPYWCREADQYRGECHDDSHPNPLGVSPVDVLAKCHGLRAGLNLLIEAHMTTGTVLRNHLRVPESRGCCSPALPTRGESRSRGPSIGRSVVEGTGELSSLIGP
jgi:hypothetical protein